jgi:hypothetical protein
MLLDQGICLDEAAAFAQAAIDAFRAAGDLWNEIPAIGVAAHLAVRLGDLASAAKLLATHVDLVDDFAVGEVAGLSAFNVAALGWLANHRAEATELVARARNLIDISTEPAGLMMRRTMLQDVPQLISVAEQSRYSPSDDYQPVLASARLLLASLQDPEPPHI